MEKYQIGKKKNPLIFSMQGMYGKHKGMVRTNARRGP